MTTSPAAPANASSGDPSTTPSISAPITASTPSAASAFTLHRDPHGQLVLGLPDGTVHAPVWPVRAFPLAAPEEGLALVGAGGRELLWIERLDLLPPALRAAIDAALAERELMPRIERLVAVSTYSTPSRWDVETDRGPTQLILKGEEDIRRLPGGALLITDSHGLAFLLPQASALDRRSRRLLERFL